MRAKRRRKGFLSRTYGRWSRFRTKSTLVRRLYIRAFFLSAASIPLLGWNPPKYLPKRGSWPASSALENRGDTHPTPSDHRSAQEPMIKTSSSAGGITRITPDWIERCILTMSKLMPWSMKCRHQAFIAVSLCKHYGIPFSVFVGANKSSFINNEIHMWVKSGDQFLSGRCIEQEYVLI